MRLLIIWFVGPLSWDPKTVLGLQQSPSVLTSSHSDSFHWDGPVLGSPEMIQIFPVKEHLYWILSGKPQDFHNWFGCCTNGSSSAGWFGFPWAVQLCCSEGGYSLVLVSLVAVSLIFFRCPFKGICGALTLFPFFPSIHVKTVFGGTFSIISG